VTGVLLGVIVLLVLGLPLVALGVDRVVPQFRGRPIPPSPLQELSRRHHLAPRDVLEVQAAVAEGRAARPSRLAPAALDYAELVAGLDVWARPVGGVSTFGMTRRAIVFLYPVLGALYLVGGLAAHNGLFVGLGVLNIVQACIQLPVQRRAWQRRTSAARAAIGANQVTSVAGAEPAGEGQ